MAGHVWVGQVGAALLKPSMSDEFRDSLAILVVLLEEVVQVTDRDMVSGCDACGGQVRLMEVAQDEAFDLMQQFPLACGVWNLVFYISQVGEEGNGDVDCR